MTFQMILGGYSQVLTRGPGTGEGATEGSHASSKYLGLITPNDRLAVDHSVLFSYTQVILY